MIVKDQVKVAKGVIKIIEDHEDQITPSILYERSHNYDWSWSIRACFVDQ